MRDGWTETTLGEVATWRSGSTPKATNPAFYDGDVPFVTIGDLNGGVVEVTEKTLTERGLREIGRLAPADSVFVSMYGTIGRVGLAGRPMATNQAMAWAECDFTRCEPRFLLAWLSQHSGYFDSLGRGATQRNINRDIVTRTPIALPPLAEQRRIVDLIEALDETIHQARGEVESATSLLGAMSETYIRWNPELMVPMTDVIARIDSGKSPVTEGRPPVDGEAAVLKLSAVKEGWFDPDETKALIPATTMPATALVQRGDVLITRSNTPERVGAVCRVAEVRPRTYLSDLVLRLHPTGRVDPDYLVEVLNSSTGRQMIRSAAKGTSGSMRKISRSTIMGHSIPLPSVDDQRVLSVTLAEVRGVIGAALTQSDSLRSLRSALLSDLLSGNHEIPESYDALLVGAA